MEVVFNKNKEGLDLDKSVYQCSVCDKLFNWDKDSIWYGSDKELEEHPERIKYFCSKKCYNFQKMSNDK
jgi:hypothetical protein